MLESPPLFLFLTLAIVCCAATPLYYDGGLKEECSFSLVESIPDNLTFNSSIKNVATYDAYELLLAKAVDNVKFASFYWTLTGADVMPDAGDLAKKGELLLNSLINKSKFIPISIAHDLGGFVYNTTDFDVLSRHPNVHLVGVNISGIMGTGVLHTKFVLADGVHAYVGSSNMDWRSFTQVKELGLLMTGCPTLVAELEKIFQTYWLTGKENRVPNPWPNSLSASINATNPWLASIGGYEYSVYVGASPAALCPPGWSRDIDAILSAILSAKEFVHIAVMNYQALTRHKHYAYSYWGHIDNALRKMAFKGVTIRLLVSHWNHSDVYVRRCVNSLTALNSTRAHIEAKFFIVPAFTPDQNRIPFARVNHNKYMVTESTAVICTSNWDGSYFDHTAGIAVYIKQTGKRAAAKANNGSLSIVGQVQAIFQRDWNSQYSLRMPN